MQLPVATPVTTAPDTVQIDGVLLVKVTALPDAPLVALTVPLPPTDTLGATPRLARTAALIADPSRARMLTLMLSGEARSAGELARAVAVTPQTASTHLAQSLDAGARETAGTRTASLLHIGGRRRGAHAEVAIHGRGARRSAITLGLAPLQATQICAQLLLSPRGRVGRAPT